MESASHLEKSLSKSIKCQGGLSMGVWPIWASVLVMSLQVVHREESREAQPTHVLELLNISQPRLNFGQQWLRPSLWQEVRKGPDAEKCKNWGRNQCKIYGIGRTPSICNDLSQLRRGGLHLCKTSDICLMLRALWGMP